MPAPIYLDYNGTTPHDPEVIKAMKPFLETEFGNPSSAHWYGIAPKLAVETARKQVAELLACAPEEILFTSGGTESNNHAIRGVARSLREKGSHIITSSIEHPAVLEVCRFLSQDGYQITYLPVDAHGQVSPSAVEAAIRPDTILITIMHANNEVGTIQPISEIADIARKHQILIHTDAAQSIGKIPVQPHELGVDLLSGAGHKLYAPKGIGFLFIRNSLTIEPFCHGAGQEKGRRAGTENVLEIVGLGKACEIANQNPDISSHQMKNLRDRLHSGILAKIQEVRLNGHPDNRLPNTLSLSFFELEANRILEEIGLEVAASAGAACHADTVEISHVLLAMGIPEEWAKGTIRFSTGRLTTEDQIDQTIEVVTRAICHLRKKQL